MENGESYPLKWRVRGQGQRDIDVNIYSRIIGVRYSIRRFLSPILSIFAAAHFRDKRSALKPAARLYVWPTGARQDSDRMIFDL